MIPIAFLFLVFLFKLRTKPLYVPPLHILALNCIIIAFIISILLSSSVHYTHYFAPFIFLVYTVCMYKSHFVRIIIVEPQRNYHFIS